MLTFHAENIRTIALLGHRGSGKTSLADALLHVSHAVDRLGNVDNQTSFSDFDEEEHKHHFSIDTTVLHLESEGKFLHLLDTPGHPDFVGASLEAVNAVETAVIVVSATNGIEINTRRMFKEAGKHELARILVINKISGENVHFGDLYQNIQDTFGKNCILFNAPDGVGADFTSVVSILNPPASIPAKCPVGVQAIRSQLVDAIVEADEAMMEKYLTEGEISFEELEKAIPRAIEAGTIIPAFCVDAKKEIGLQELLHALDNYALPPDHANLRLKDLKVGANGSTHAFQATETEEFIGQVFKIINDKFVGHMCFLRVMSGQLSADKPLVNIRTGKSGKIGHLYMIQGKEHQQVVEAYPGDIVAITKIDDLHIGDTVAHTMNVPNLPQPEFPKPMFGLAIAPKKRGDEQKISQSLHKLEEEDPTFKVTHDEQTHEMIMSGVGQTHLDVIQERLKHRFDLEVVTKEPKIPYRETIQNHSEGDYRHKKQSGGRGQFAEVHLRIFPLSREITSQAQLEENFANKSRFEKMRAVSYDPQLNFAFIDHIVGGSIPNQYIPAVEKGCRELMDFGALAGYRMQDIAVEVHFGKEHPVDSSETAFRIAAKHAFKKAFLSARPVLLEPIVRLEVTIPTRFTGAILSDINGKRGHVEDQETLPGELSVIIAEVPLAEISRYTAQLGSLTQGQGSYVMEFSHYEHVPMNVQQQIVSKANLRHDDEE
ncbi:elongation factor G [Telmatocola sphagniphila]|uniref:Elongation factor G n=1 Tax=Telmatocola sphagniphila TaxID=1123043 RepID=A0A8E6EYN7_9BACT|nr:elongation factor G [Telmatocola sphagniphila]QVL32858.1 elongation factor G [Telmatocola sphagniphila]